MDTSSITNELTDRLTNKTVIAGVFTTYNFEPEFFELEIISELMNPSVPYSTDERVKLFQVREALRKSNIRLDVFYDLPMYRKSAERSPQMEHLCHGVHMGNAAFHGKNIYLLVKDNDSGQQSLLMAAGSNNITRAGWWYNVEVQHWEAVVSGDVQRAYLYRLREDIAWLKNRLTTPDSEGIGLIEEFLGDCRGSNSAAPVDYFNLVSSRFKPFLRDRCGRLFQQDDGWSLEIISPYFPDDPHSDLHLKLFSDFDLEKITLFLPRNQDDEALCHEDYFHHINESERISWGCFADQWKESLGISKQLFRVTHAKIYHFYNGKQSWMFVGSVNFTRKATHDNIESGFFVQIEGKGRPLLQLIAPDNVEQFASEVDCEPGKFDADPTTTLPELHISYDWKSKTLSGRSAKKDSYKIRFKNAENEFVIRSWSISDEPSIYKLSDKVVEQVESMLRLSGLVTVTGTNTDTQEAFEPHRILIQQTGWTHKPLDLPDLSAEDILAIYAGMTAEQQELLILNAQIKKLFLQQMGGEISRDEYGQVEEQFFCEFAEIFHAFRMLKKRLTAAVDDDNLVQVDYYLTGTGLDSIPALVEKVCQSDRDNLSAVTAYLILLCSLEIFKERLFRSRPNVKKYRKKYLQELEALKSGDQIQLEDNSESRRSTFFDWFETQFFKEYRQQTADKNEGVNDAS